LNFWWQQNPLQIKMSSRVNHNGTLCAADEASVPFNNRAFRYGYGLFETILVREGAIPLAAYHWERLFSGLPLLGFALPDDFSPDFLEEQVLRCVAANSLEHLCRVRLQVYGGRGDLAAEEREAPGFIVECFPLDSDLLPLNREGLRVGLAEGVRKAADVLSGLKTTSALLYLHAARQARRRQWDDALILNTQGHIVESSIANIFWIKEEKLFTPPLEDGCVAGVMRRFVMERAAAAGISLSEQSLTTDLLADADEVFLTNAIRGIKWVGSVEGHAYDHRVVEEWYPALSLP
jgi:branched-chain amino acid aminotransferase